MLPNDTEEAEYTSSGPNDRLPISRRRLMQGLGALGGTLALPSGAGAVVGEGKAEVVVRAERAEPPLLAQDAGVVDELKAVANRSQQPIVDYVRSTDGLTVENRFWLANALLLGVDTSVVDLEALRAQDGVKAIHENHQFSVPEPLDNKAPPPDTDATYGLNQIDAPNAWDALGSRGGGARVAVLDTGVDPDNPAIDVAEENFAEIDENGDPVEGVTPYDSSFHGTHVSGTATGGTTDDGTSIGVAPDATLLHGLVLPGGSGSFTRIIGGMQWAVENDADVMNMSFGPSGGGFLPGMVEPIRNAERAGTIAVASCGNAGEGTSGSPGNVYEATAVGATNDAEGIAGFSSGDVVDTSEDWGDDAPAEWPAEYIVPDVSAPGVEVLSAYPTDHADGPFHRISGTSMASPHVAGLVGLVASVAQDEYGQDAIMEAIRTTTWSPDDDPSDPDVRYGHGIVDALHATSRVAANSGVTGTVTGPDGKPIEGATVDLAGFTVETDSDGGYRLRAHPGEYEVTASGFGYTRTSKTATVTEESFTDLDFRLSNNLAVDLVQGQPEGLEAGNAFDVVVRVANVDALTVELAGPYQGGADLLVDGTEERFGQPVTFDPARSGEVTITVETVDSGFGDLELDLAFEGVGSSTTLTTGPTSVFAESVPVGVVDVEDGLFTTDIVGLLDEELHPRFRVSTVTPAEAVTAAENRDHEAYVVQNLGSDAARITEFESVAAAPEIGVVYLDQFGAASDAASQLADVTGDPNATVDILSRGFAPPIDYTVRQSHQLLEGIVAEGESVTINHPDPVVTLGGVFGGFHTHYEDYAGEVAGTTLAATEVLGTETGPAFGVDDLSRTVLASSLGVGQFVLPGDFTLDGRAILGAAVEHAAQDPQVDAVELPDQRIPPGESTSLVIEADELLELEVTTSNVLFIEQSDLELTVDGDAVDFGETITYDDPFTGEIEVTIASPTDNIGQFAFNTRFLALGDRDREVETGVAFPPTTVYESPVNVPQQIEDLQVAVDFVQPGDTVVLADGTYEVRAPDRGFQSGLFVETPGITLRAAEGAEPDVIHARDYPAPNVINIDANDVTIDGVNANVVDGSIDPKNEIAAGIKVRDGTSGVTIKNLTGAGTWAVHLRSTSDLTVENVTAVDSVTGVGTDLSFFGTIEDATITNLTVKDSPDYSFSGGVDITSGANRVTVTDCDIDIRDTDMAGVRLVGPFDGGTGCTVENNTINGPGVEEQSFPDANNGVFTDQVGGVVENNDINDTFVGVRVGGNFNFGNQEIDVLNNDIDVTGIGYRQFSDYATVRENVVTADTGLQLGEDPDAFFPALIEANQVIARYNDLSNTDVPMTGVPEEAFFDPVKPLIFDCRLNHLGDRGYDDTVADGDVVYDPFLTAPPEEADLPDPTTIGTDAYLEPNTTYALGVPGPTDRTIYDVLETDGFRDFRGKLEYFDQNSEEWQKVTGNGELKEIDTLDAFRVTPKRGHRVTIDFRRDDDKPPGLRDHTPGEKRLKRGWNVVTAPRYGARDVLLDHDRIEAVQDPMASPERQLGDATVDAFTGYKVKATGDATIAAGITEYAPTMTDVYEGVGLDPTIHESPGVPPANPFSTTAPVEAIIDDAPDEETAVGALTELIGKRIAASSDDQPLREAVEATATSVAEETPSTDEDLVKRAMGQAITGVFEERFGVTVLDDDGLVEDESRTIAKAKAERDGSGTRSALSDRVDGVTGHTSP